jgi:hypothetical protein
LPQTVATFGSTGLLLEQKECLAVFRTFEKLVDSVVAREGGDLGFSVEEPDVGIGSAQGEDSLCEGRRDGIAVFVKADEGGLVGFDGLDLVDAREGIGRTKEEWLLLGKELGDRAVWEVGMGALGRNGPEEFLQLLIADLEVRNRSSGKEAVPQIAHGSLDTTLLPWGADLAEPRLNPQRAAQLQEQRMKLSLVAVTLQHDGLGIVKQPGSGTAPKVIRRADEGATQRVNRQIEDELGPQSAGIGKHHHEDPERASAARNLDFADAAPVDLRLLAGKHLGAEEDLGRGPRTDLLDVVADGAGRALKLRARSMS